MLEDTAAAETAAAPESLSDVIGSAFDQAAAALPAEPVRGEDGKFAPREAPEGTQPPAEPVATEDKPETTEATAPEPLEPPASLTAAAKERWAEIPRELQETILEQAGASARELEQKAKEADSFKPYRALFDEHAPMLAAKGLEPLEATRRLLAAQAALETKPVEAIAALARSYGVDLSRFAQPAPQQVQGDPQVMALQREVAELRQFLAGNVQNAQQATEAQAQAQVEAFRKDAAHPHFDAVRPIMGSLIQSGAASDMQSAYDMAIRAHPEVSRKIAADEARAAVIRRDREAKEAAARAVSARGSPPSPASREVPDDVISTLRAAFDGRLN